MSHKTVKLSKYHNILETILNKMRRGDNPLSNSEFNRLFSYLKDRITGNKLILKDGEDQYELDLDATETFENDLGNDFRGKYLMFVNFKNIISELNKNYTKIHFGAAHLEGANFEGTDLSKSLGFLNTNLTQTNLKNANLTNLNIYNAIVKETNFEGATLKTTYFSARTTLDKVIFKGANLENTQFGGVSFIETDFTNARILKANFQGADFTNPNFTDADLTGSNFTGAMGIDINDPVFSKAIVKRKYSADYSKSYEPAYRVGLLGLSVVSPVLFVMSFAVPPLGLALMISSACVTALSLITLGAAYISSAKNDLREHEVLVPILEQDTYSQEKLDKEHGSILFTTKLLPQNSAPSQAK